jgi:hypothetical protein
LPGAETAGVTGVTPTAPVAPAQKPPAAPAPAAPAPAQKPPVAPAPAPTGPVSGAPAPAAPAPTPTAPVSAAPAATAPKPSYSSGLFGFGKPGATAPYVSSQADLEKMGLRIKQGDVQAEGSKVSPKLIEIAKQIQSSLPDFAYFSGFNDRYHQEKASSSKHTQGLAADFSLSSPPSKERGEEIISMLKGLGASYVADEYNYPSSRSTAGHIHLQVPEFEKGGLASGPDSGYAATLHGTEAVIPLDNNQGNFVKVFEEIADNSRATTMLLEELIKAQKSSVDVQEKILRTHT